MHEDFLQMYHLCNYDSDQDIEYFRYPNVFCLILSSQEQPTDVTTIMTSNQQR